MKSNITLINGESLSYIEMGQGNKVIIALHGTHFTSQYFKPLFEKLKDDYKLYAIDLRGHGDSTYFRSIENTGDLAEDVKLFIKAFEIKDPIIIGWELGAGVALDFAARFTNIPSKIVLINGISHRGEPIFMRNENGKMQVGHIFDNQKDMAESKIKHNDIVRSITNNDYETFKELFNNRYPTTNGITIPEEWIKDSFKQKDILDLPWALSHFNLSDTHNFYTPGIQTINRIKIPILHLWGEKDNVISKSTIHSVYRAVQDQSKLITYKDAGHLLVLEEAEQLAVDLKAFIEQ